ncbi:MAG: bifunctional oligoribonuclease/PAP phosphatase NrnA [Coriobacteriales bacterium]|nr:bifunctional oligoribonuclease/PAP phosphatase NrnA [Coriobacteriales bacterium]
MESKVRLGPASAEEYAQQEAGFASIMATLAKARTIAICAHTSPDGDALGSQLGLALIIEALWPQTEVRVLLADERPAPHIYSFLPGFERLEQPSAYEDDPDVFVAVDLSDPRRLHEAQAVCERAGKVVVIDHHPPVEGFGDAKVVRTGAAAVGVIIAELALFAGVELTPDIAQNLMCAIVTDTGRFQYQNADGEAFRAASLLVDSGASPSQISLHVYESFGLPFLHLKSLVLGRITTFEQGRIAYSYATQSDFERTGANLDECDGLIDAVRSVEGSQIALFLKAVPGGKVRGNLRSKGDHDVSCVAQMMGGGGHKAAAGFTFEGSVDEALVSVLPSLRKLLHGQDEDGECQSGQTVQDGAQ